MRVEQSHAKSGVLTYCIQEDKYLWPVTPFVKGVFKYAGVFDKVQPAKSKADCDICILTATAGTGRFEWRVAIDNFAKNATGRKLNVLFFQQKQNDDNILAELDPHEPEDRKDVEAFERLHREKNAYMLTLGYHFETGIWHPSKSSTNKDALDRFTAALRALV